MPPRRRARPARALSIRSGADAPAPDASLAGEAFTHRGLTYPLGRNAPAAGTLTWLAEGVGWVRLPLPSALDHINTWVLDDGDGIAIVDTGVAAPAVEEAWDGLLGGELAGRPLTRVLVTHFHPDHLGLAGWLTGRSETRLWMTRGEWLWARMLTGDVRETPPKEAFAHWRFAGWSEAEIAAEAALGWGRFAGWVSPLPASYVRLQDGDTVRIGARDWQVVTGSGHSPEHACLVDFEGGLMIAGDQVLPRITSNVSLSLSEPEADPLGEWLASIAKLRQLPDDLLVLPAHGLPFTGLHVRLDALAEGHGGRLDALVVHLAEPRRAVDCFGVLFARDVTEHRGLATGEALAHLRHLEATGRAVREMRDGVAWFRAA